jgi:YVTN family beta-propeller protein
MTPDGTAVYASSDGDSKASVIDTVKDAVTDAIEVGAAPHGLAVTPDGRTVLAAVFGASSFVFIDTSIRKVTGRVSVANPHNIAGSPDGRSAYVAAVQVLDVASDTVSRQVPVGASPHYPLFTADGRDARVVSQGPGTLSSIDPTRDAVKASVKVGALPHWIAVTGRVAYVTDEDSGDVSVVNLDSMTVAATIPVGDAPRKNVIQPDPAIASSQAPSSPAVTSRIAGFAFEDAITIAAGQAVTWTNTDPVPHTVTSDTRLWDSGALASGARRHSGFVGTSSSSFPPIAWNSCSLRSMAAR